MQEFNSKQYQGGFVKQYYRIAKWSVLSGGISLALFASINASAAGIQLFHAYSATATGDADAGGAARADDATTTYTNPAGLARLQKQQLIFSAVDISTDLKFKGTNTWSSPGFPSYSQIGQAQGGMNMLYPTLFYTRPLTDRLSFGFSTASPFGLKTTYGESSIVRYSGTKGEIAVLDLSPALGFKINDHYSIGAGLDFDRIIARIDAMVGAPGLFGPSADTIGKNNAYGWGYGAHIGLLYQPNQDTRFGLTYRSRVSSNLSGFGTLSGPLVQFQGVPSGVLELRNFKTRLVFPPVATVSVYRQVTSRWAAEGSMNYVQWSTIPGLLTLNNIPGFPPTTPITVILPQHFRDTWYLAGGVNFQANTQWLIRAGLSFDQSPVKSSERNIFLPDGNRIGTSIGAHYQANKMIGFDAGWTHLFVQNVSVNLPTVISNQTSTTTGSYRNHADLVGVQAVLTFA